MQVHWELMRLAMCLPCSFGPVFCSLYLGLAWCWRSMATKSMHVALWGRISMLLFCYYCMCAGFLAGRENASRLCMITHQFVIPCNKWVGCILPCHHRVVSVFCWVGCSRVASSCVAVFMGNSSCKMSVIPHAFLIASSCVAVFIGNSSCKMSDMRLQSMCVIWGAIVLLDLYILFFIVQ